MKIFKFGGASVKDAEAVKNVAEILRLFSGEHIVIVISAMGKMTNALEEVVHLAYQQKNYKASLETIKYYHTNIINQLSLPLSLDYFYDLIITHAEANRQMQLQQYYDQIVSIGELMSTTIVSSYLHAASIENEWLDARDVIKTDATWREGVVNWKETTAAVESTIPEKLLSKHIITQGFIGKTPGGFTTTLGREGSDYTGAILANILDAEGLYIWKDVPGVLNADPKIFSETVNIPVLTYYEAIEMTYYGATVIHPKTIKPLQNKQIPLYVKSFLHPEFAGTIVHYDALKNEYPPVIILKKNQTLLSILTTDFSFVAENNLSTIYNILSKHNIKVNMMQTAAMSCTISIDTNNYKEKLLETDLQKEYKIVKNENLSLLTIRHYTDKIVSELTEGKAIILTQKSRNTIQVLFEI